jgi:hypothetical protein
LHAVIITAIADADYVTIIAVIILFCFELIGMFIIFRPDVSAQQKFKLFLWLLFWDNRPCMYTLLCLHAVIITAIADADYVTIIAVVILFFAFEFPGIFDTPLY